MKKGMGIGLVVGLLIIFCDYNSSRAEDYSTPENTYQSYLEACKEVNFEKADRCFSEKSNKFFHSDANYMAHRYPGQLSNLYNELKGKSYKIEKHENKAVLRFTPPLKTESPIYFKKEEGNWKIDAKFMYDNIIYGGSGWHWRDSNKNNEKEWLNDE